jgi:phosphate transport system permease protein
MSMSMNHALYRRRRFANALGMVTSMMAMALGLTVLLWILAVLFTNGLAALDWNILTKDTPAPGTDGGGLRNAIVGSLMMVGLSVLVATPVGILAGIYLTEYGDQSKTADLTRCVTDIMLSAPSIVSALRGTSVDAKKCPECFRHCVQ